MSTLFIGLMSGTSMDAIDAVIMDFSDSEHSLLATYRHEIPEELRSRALAITQSAEIPDPESRAKLDHALGRLFAAAANGVIQKGGCDPATITAIGSPGQTVLHSPDSDPPFTLQLGDAKLIATSTGVPTVAGFRVSDMAAGGQGAPLVPAYHNAIFRSAETDRVIVNIGGIANITILPSDQQKPVTGFDTGPGNALMDDWSRQHIATPMDYDGEWAATGSVHQRLLDVMLKDEYFNRDAPKSTGREFFNPGWIEKQLAQTDSRPGNADIQATLCELTAVSITQAIQKSAPTTREVIACGGGTHNGELMRRLADALDDRILNTTADFGVDPGLVEPAAFAWLAKQTMEDKPGNVPAVTGARAAVVLGEIFRPAIKADTR